MIRKGLKIWAINQNYLESARALVKRGVFSYIELFALPLSFENCAGMWRNLQKETGIPFIIHAPHFSNGMNLADPAKEKENTGFVHESARFADLLQAEMIIVHPGVKGSPDECLRQLSKINEGRLIIENKPAGSYTEQWECRGADPEEMAYLLRESGLGFCLDAGHAFCAAAARVIEPIKFLGSFFNLQPRLFHICDGEITDVRDDHKHLGKGTYPLDSFIKMLPDQAMLTIETEKSLSDSLDDVLPDAAFIDDKTGGHGKN